MTEDEMVGWHHQLNEYEFDQAPEVDDGQGGLACCSSWGRKESDTTEQLNRTELRCRQAKVVTRREPAGWEVMINPISTFQAWGAQISITHRAARAYQLQLHFFFRNFFQVLL